MCACIAVSPERRLVPALQLSLDAAKETACPVHCDSSEQDSRRSQPQKSLPLCVLGDFRAGHPGQAQPQHALTVLRRLQLKQLRKAECWLPLKRGHCPLQMTTGQPGSVTPGWERRRSVPFQLLPSQLLSSSARSGSLQGSVSRAGLAPQPHAAPVVPGQEEAGMPASAAKTAQGASPGKHLSTSGGTAGSRLQETAGWPKRLSSGSSPAVSGAGGAHAGAVPAAAFRDGEQAAVATQQPGEPEPPAALTGSRLTGTGGEAGGIQSASTEAAAEGESASSRSASIGSVSEPAAPAIWSIPSGPLTTGAQTPSNDPDADGPLGSNPPQSAGAAVPAVQAGDVSAGAREPAEGGREGSRGNAVPTSQAAEASRVARELADSNRADAVLVSQAEVATRAAPGPAEGGQGDGTPAAAQAAGVAEAAAEPSQQGAVLSDGRSGAGRGGGEAAVSDDLVGSLVGEEQQHAHGQLSAAQEPTAPAAEAAAVLAAADRPQQHHLQLPEVPAPPLPEAPRAAAQHLRAAESEDAQLSRASSGVHQAPGSLCDVYWLQRTAVMATRELPWGPSIHAATFKTAQYTSAAPKGSALACLGWSVV